MTKTAVKKATKEVKRFNLDNMVKRVKEGAFNANDFILENSEELVQEAIARGEQWQNVGFKAVKGGLKLSANTQDIVFDVLGTLKDQLTDGRSRIKSLFSRN